MRDTSRRNADEAEWGFSAKRTKITAIKTETTKEVRMTFEKDFRAFLKAHELTTKLKARKVYRGIQLKVCQSIRASYERSDYRCST